LQHEIFMAEANASTGFDWIALMRETREALAHLRTDELEALAQRANAALDATAKNVPRGDDLRELAARHRVLGDVLQVTERNLNVLRRLRGQEPEGSARWAR
jgi:hypothetical protein